MTILLIAQVALGIGLVIFVHELGHFLAARRAGAHVEVFSIGIGPKLFGWERGGTMFQLAALPLGGFVKVAGEYPVEGGREARQGELGAMSVGHRFVYYSGGVVMNLLFALVVLPLVLFAGLPITEPVFGTPSKGTPAWHERIEAGTRVELINGRDPFDFGGVRTEVALSGRDPVELELALPDGGRRSLAIRSEYDEELGFYRMGVRPDYEPDRRLTVEPDSPAAAAGLTDEDRLVGIVGQPEALLPEEQFQRALADGGPMTVRVARGSDAVREVTIEPEVSSDEGRKRLGIAPRSTRVLDLRRGPNGTEGPAQRLGLQVDDVVVAVGSEALWSSVDFLPALLAAPDALEVRVRRGESTVVLSTDGLDEAARIALDEDVFLSSNVEASEIVVADGTAAAEAGVLNGDVVLAVDGNDTATWERVFELVQARTRRSQPARLTVRRSGMEEPVEIEVVPAPLQLERYGFGLPYDAGVKQADGLGDAVATGVLASWRFLVDTWQTLKKMVLTDEVSTKNLGGIITISVVSYETASAGWAKLFFFLAILSVNLAILNILPIPILDGGHLLFLLVEALKGSPVSERTLGYSQVVGLVLLLSLMIYVTYQDVMRWIIGP